LQHWISFSPTLRILSIFAGNRSFAEKARAVLQVIRDLRADNADMFTADQYLIRAIVRSSQLADEPMHKIAF